MLPPDVAPEMVLDVQDLLLSQHTDKITQQQILNFYIRRLRSSTGSLGRQPTVQHRRDLLKRSIKQATSRNTNNTHHDATDIAASGASTSTSDDEATRVAVMTLLSQYVDSTSSGTASQLVIPRYLTAEMLQNCPLERMSELTNSQQCKLLATYTQKFHNVAEKNSAIWNTPKFQRALFVTSIEQAAVAPVDSSASFKTSTAVAVSKTNSDATTHVLKQPETQTSASTGPNESAALQTQPKKLTKNESQSPAKKSTEPEFRLRGNALVSFKALSPQQQDEARLYCVEAAKEEEQIFNPNEYFKSQFQRWLNKQPAAAAAVEATAKSNSSGVPDFELKAGSLAIFESLSAEQQKEARQFCIQQAQGQGSIKHPPGFYSSQLKVFVQQLRKEGQGNPQSPPRSSAVDVSSSDTLSSVPTFELNGDALASFKILSPQEQNSARDFCREAAKGRTIKNRVAFYNSRFANFLEQRKKNGPLKEALPQPPFPLPTENAPSFEPHLELPGDALSTFTSLSPALQKEARQFCHKTANAQSIETSAELNAAQLKKIIDQQKTKSAALSSEKATARKPASFELRGDALTTFEALSKTEQEEARRFCISALKPHHTRSLHSFFAAQLEIFLEQHPKPKAAIAPTERLAEAAVPAFDLVGDAKAAFESLTREHQEAARRFCLDAAKKQSTIRNPFGFYCSQLNLYIEKNQPFTQPSLSSVDEETASTDTNAQNKFDVRGTDAEAAYESLTPARKLEARQYCLELARGRPLQNPRHFYAALVKQYLAGEPRKSGVDLRLNASLSSLFDKLVPRQQEAARKYCEEAVRNTTQVGRIIRNLEAYNVATFQSFLKDKIVSADIPEIGFHADAQNLYDKLLPLEQCVARKNLEDCARTVIESGRAIHDPFSFYSNILHKSLEKGKFVGAIPKFALKETIVRKFYKLSPEEQIAARRSCEDCALAEILRGQDISNPVAFYSKALERVLMHKRSRSGGDQSASATSTSEIFIIDSNLKEEIEQLRNELSETQVLLEASKKECLGLIQSNQQLTKIWETEKNTAITLANRLKQAEEDVFSLRQELKAKSDAFEDLSSAKGQLEQKYSEELEMAREVTGSFAKISRELVLSNEGKRSLDMELAKEQERSREKDREIQKLRADIKRMDMLRPSVKKSDSGSDKVLDKIKQELKETREKLEKEKKKNASIIAAKKQESLVDAVAKRPPEKPSLADHLPEVILNTKPAAVRILTRLTAPSSPSPPPPPHAESQNRSASAIDISFDGINASFDAPKSELEERISQELNFLQASYSRDELIIEGNKVTRKLRLGIDRDEEEIIVHLVLTIRDGYPVTVPLCVEAMIWPEGSSKRVDAHKVANDAVPALANVCQCEANMCVGSEAMFPTLQAADQWVNLEWSAVQAKRLSNRDRKDSQDLELCRLLISTHHIHDSERIHSVIKATNKYDLGGYIKTGKPGFILVEGLDDNCQFFLETIIQEQKKMRESKSGKAESSSYAIVGKSAVTVADFDQERALPRKMIKIEHSKEGMAELEKECGKVGLAEFLSF